MDVVGVGRVLRFVLVVPDRRLGKHVRVSDRIFGIGPRKRRRFEDRQFERTVGVGGRIRRAVHHRAVVRRNFVPWIFASDRVAVDAILGASSYNSSADDSSSSNSIQQKRNHGTKDEQRQQQRQPQILF